MCACDVVRFLQQASILVMSASPASASMLPCIQLHTHSFRAHLQFRFLAIELDPPHRQSLTVTKLSTVCWFTPCLGLVSRARPLGPLPCRYRPFNHWANDVRYLDESCIVGGGKLCVKVMRYVIKQSPPQCCARASQHCALSTASSSEIC